jgi:uncharacterized damage-inducible protein DinB
MPIVDSLLPEFDHEFATTRKLLERLPDADLGWKPHDKSMSLGQLATHVANIGGFWCTQTMNAPSYDASAANDPEARLAPASSRDALLKEFDEKIKAARAAVAGKTDAEMMAPWTLKMGSHEIFTMPRVAVYRSFIMNHMIHHRGQLSVYLRLRDVPLPSIYGPSADEQ